MSGYLAIVEADQRQKFILQADKLLEMLGGSRLIAQTRERAEDQARRFAVRLIWPVSGVLWFVSEDLSALSQALWSLRESLHEMGLSVTFAVGRYTDENFTEGVHRLQESIKRNKDSKGGEDGSPRCPLFAQCSIQGIVAANHWNPKEQEGRRRLIAADTKRRLKEVKESDDYRQDLLRRFEFRNVGKYYKPFVDFDDVVVSQSDSYIALIRGDGDGLGELLLKTNWNDLAARLEIGGRPTDAALQFATELNKVMHQALRNAVDRATEDDPYQGTHCFPVIPLVQAGDDLWILCRRDLALRLASEVGTEYEKLANNNDVLCAAAEAASFNRKLTISFGVLFAKQGFPFDAQMDYAEELESIAKRDGTRVRDAGCLDYHWLESSAREFVNTTRERGSTYELGDTCLLTTRPWTHEECKSVIGAAQEFTGISRRKRHQLNTILRYGRGLSDLAYRRWQQGLGGHESKHLQGALELLPERLRPRLGPWADNGNSVFASILPELAEVAEIVSLPQREAEAA